MVVSMPNSRNIKMTKPDTSTVEVDDIDVEIAIAEAIAVLPPRTVYDEKGVPILAYLKKHGWKVMEPSSAKKERDDWLKQPYPRKGQIGNE